MLVGGARRLGQPRVRIRPGRRARRTSPTSSSASTLRAPAGSPTGSRLCPTCRVHRPHRGHRTSDSRPPTSSRTTEPSRSSVRVVGATRSSPAATLGAPGQVVVEKRAGRRVAPRARRHARHRRTRHRSASSASPRAPTTSSYPLASPRVYVSQRRHSVPAGRGQPGRDLAARPGATWTRCSSRRARPATACDDLRFVTRSGVRVLLDQAAGIVIDLLVALSLIALATASVMLAASARAEVQRRLAAIGVRRAVGASRAHLAATQAFEALFVAAPAATIGAVGGALATYGPTSRLLVLLNEPAPGTALLPRSPRRGWRASRSRCSPPRGRRGGRRGGRRWRCSAAPSSAGTVLAAPPTPGAGLTALGARLVGARRDPAGRHRGRARVLDRVRAADARARLGAQLARDRSAGARQALPADRGPARLGGRPRARDPRRRGGRAALRDRGRRLVSRSARRST